MRSSMALHTSSHCQLCRNASAANICVDCAVQILQHTFSYSGSTALPIASFRAWQTLCDVVHKSGSLQQQHGVVLHPILQAFKVDRRSDVHKVCPMDLARVA